MMLTLSRKDFRLINDDDDDKHDVNDELSYSQTKQQLINKSTNPSL